MDFWKYIKSLIDNEVNNLKKEWKIKEWFKIEKCLIKLPKWEKEIVYINNIPWVMICDNADYEVWKDIHLSDLIAPTDVEFPKHKWEKVAYIFIFFNWFKYITYFDFTPNSISQDKIPDENHWGSKIITNYYNILFTEQVYKSLDKKVIKELNNLNYFITPSLLPYPINLLLKKDINVFKKELILFFDNNMLKEINKKWFTNIVFKERKELFLECFLTYENALYTSCISTLIPQIEWVLREFIFIKNWDVEKTNSLKAYKKVKLIFDSENKLNVLNNIIEDFWFYFNNSKWFFQQFKNWNDSLSNSFISRHAHSHWKYNENSYSKENCIRLFLILDLFYYMINNINEWWKSDLDIEMEKKLY